MVATKNRFFDQLAAAIAEHIMADRLNAAWARRGKALQAYQNARRSAEISYWVRYYMRHRTEPWDKWPDPEKGLSTK